LVIELPPVLPGVHDSATRPSPGVPVTADTAPGSIDGVTATRGLERPLQPTAFSDWMET